MSYLDSTSEKNRIGYLDAINCNWNGKTDELETVLQGKLEEILASFRACANKGNDRKLGTRAEIAVRKFRWYRCSDHPLSQILVRFLESRDSICGFSPADRLIISRSPTFDCGYYFSSSCGTYLSSINPNILVDLVVSKELPVAKLKGEYNIALQMVKTGRKLPGLFWRCEYQFTKYDLTDAACTLLQDYYGDQSLGVIKTNDTFYCLEEFFAKEGLKSMCEGYKEHGINVLYDQASYSHEIGPVLCRLLLSSNVTSIRFSKSPVLNLVFGREIALKFFSFHVQALENVFTFFSTIETECAVPKEMKAPLSSWIKETIIAFQHSPFEYNNTCKVKRIYTEIFLSHRDVDLHIKEFIDHLQSQLKELCSGCRTRRESFFINLRTLIVEVQGWGRPVHPHYATGQKFKPILNAITTFALTDGVTSDSFKECFEGITFGCDLSDLW